MQTLFQWLAVVIEQKEGHDDCIFSVST